MSCELQFFHKNKQISSEDLDKLIELRQTWVRLAQNDSPKKSITCQTKFLKNAVEAEKATELYNFLKQNIKWEDGIKSRRSGFTRKAKALRTTDIPCIPCIRDVILNTLHKLTNTVYLIQGIYLNYYENGTHHTPNHSHKGSHQLVISLGQTRTLNVGTKDYSMENGDAIIFGGSVHGVPKDNSVNGRISIATFMVPMH